jgi:hypothetical protein
MTSQKDIRSFYQSEREIGRQREGALRSKDVAPVMIPNINLRPSCNKN